MEIPIAIGRGEAWLYFFIGLAVLVNFSGLFIPLMDPDAGVYASVTKHMVERNDYLGLYFQGSDWLDKPHFPFWVTAAFFKVFGISTWSYKLPGILFALLGAYYTYLFAKQHYSKTIGLWAAFILLTAEHFIISNSDVRAEPFLTALVIAAVYHFSKALSKKLSGDLVAACFFAGCAIMTKGIFTLVPIGGAIAGQLIITKQWKEIFHWRWLVAAVLLVLFISPELYSLWWQFDQHPEKTVFGKNNVSGIRFFLWDSQFGRFANSGPIKGKGDPTFFFHTLLWAFLPWSLLMYAALVSATRQAIGMARRVAAMPELFTLCGSLLALLLFSLSKFQLPYYTNIIFPFLAVLTAQYINQLLDSSSVLWRRIHEVLAVILMLAGILLNKFYAPVNPSWPVTIFFLLFIIGGSLLTAGVMVSKNVRVFIYLGFASLVLNLYLNWFFYPDLMKYQSGDVAAKYLNKHHPGPAVRMGIYSPGFEFYLKDTMLIADTTTILNPGPAKQAIWFISEEWLNYMKEKNIRYEVIKEFPEFHVTMLSLKFINKKTREKELKKTFLVRLL
ncbi:MAG: glycosyltransferase family 39 protein [Chitinophagaceae bacterium]